MAIIGVLVGGLTTVILLSVLTAGVFILYPKMQAWGEAGISTLTSSEGAEDDSF